MYVFRYVSNTAGGGPPFSLRKKSCPTPSRLTKRWKSSIEPSVHRKPERSKDLVEHSRIAEM